MSIPNIFNANIAQQINAALGSRVFPTVLTKVTTARDPSNPTLTVETRTTHTCRGFTSDRRELNLPETKTKGRVNFIIILGASLPDGVAPEPEDEVQVSDGSIDSSTTFIIATGGVSRDPAGATYTCEVR